jgi:hypothetical protein
MYRKLAQFAGALWCVTTIMLLTPTVSAQEMAPLRLSLSTVTGAPLSGKVVLHQDGRPIRSYLLPTGRVESQAPVGTYEAFVYANTRRVAMLVEIMPLEVRPGSGAELSYELLEGATEAVPLTAFDQDGDRVLDRVEIAYGTDPNDPTSYPGAIPVPFPNRVLSSEAGWYRGELHAHTTHGRGTESVRELIRRAERTGLDFLAITDRNTMDAVHDPEFNSDRVVLIPGMEWGNEERGFALIYGPRTLPTPADTMQDAQAIVERVQYQGGLFTVAHPCHPHAPWQWGLSHVNSIQVWCRNWREVPGTSYRQLIEPLRARQQGRLVHSIALAMANPLRTQSGSQSEIPSLSANGQAQRFFDYEMARGLKAGVIGGSNTASAGVPMGAPVTYVYAREKSAEGILEGIRLGRTMVARNLDAPRISFKADAGANGRIDVGEGGVVPLGMETDFIFHVEGGRGLKVQLLENGIPIRTIEMKTNREGYAVNRKPTGYSVYRVRVFGPDTGEGFGPNDMYAISSPIYAQTVLPYDPELGPDAFWLRLDPDATTVQEPDFTQLPSVAVENLQRF